MFNSSDSIKCLTKAKQISNTLVQGSRETGGGKMGWFKKEGVAYYKKSGSLDAEKQIFRCFQNDTEHLQTKLISAAKY